MAICRTLASLWQFTVLPTWLLSATLDFKNWNFWLSVRLRGSVWVIVQNSVKLFLRYGNFWVTVCKMVCPMLSDHCLSVLSCLSVTLVYCGQTVGWINMKLGMQVGIGTGQIVLDADSGPTPPKGHNPQFSAHVHCGQTGAHLSYCWARVNLAHCNAKSGTPVQWTDVPLCKVVRQWPNDV